MFLTPYLFDLEPPPAAIARKAARKSSLNQYFLPPWAAELIYDRELSHLNRHDLVLDVGSGTGNTLAAIPAHVPAVGVEIDPALAAIARQRTGRPVLCDDFTTMPLPNGLTALFGNPPWVIPDVDALLARAGDVLPERGKCVFVLPSYSLNSSKRVLRWNRLFTLEQKALPRSLFPGLERPVIMLSFTRSARPVLIGFELYPEFFAIQKMPKAVRDILNHEVAGPRGVWRRVADYALAMLGGEADLDTVYQVVEPRRPTPNPNWKEQLRKVLQDERHFRRTARGRYAKTHPAAA